MRNVYAEGRAWIELHMENLRYNAGVLQNLLKGNCVLMPAVKADAYGHGAEAISRELQKLGIRHYCVASAEEGTRLRQAGIQGEILVLGYTHPRDFEQLKKYDLVQTVVDCDYGKELDSYGKELPVHVGIDTGMHRLGESFEHYSRIRKLWDCKNLRITGLYSHLCTSDGRSRRDRAYMRLQEARFQDIIKKLRQEGKKDFTTHIQGSYGILNGKELTGIYDFARVGIALYGVFSERSRELEHRYRIKPVLSLKARVASVREMKEGEGAGYGLAWHADSSRKLAAVTIGYADGLPRSLSNKGHALVKGRKVPVIGRVCMDQLLLDVTEVPGIQTGDEVVFIGESGKERIRVEELAEESGSISNEILSRLGSRLRRVII